VVTFRLQRERLTGKMRDMQTELLHAFHAWGRPIELRTAALLIFEERLTLLANRPSRSSSARRPIAYP
jgi:hypothetical protein